MVRFLELVLENFMSYRQRLKINLENQGIVRIEGPNMAGKSTIIEALCWALYGKTLRGLKHDSVVHRFHGKRDCLVEVWFRVQGTRWRVRRYRRHREHSNKLLLHRGAEKVAMAYRHESDTQQAIERLLGFDFSGFINSTVFGGMEGGRKSFALLTDSERKRVLDSFLRFEKFDTALERAKSAKVGAEKELTNTELDLQKLSGLIEGTKTNLAFISKRLREQKESDQKEISKLKRRVKRFQLPERVSSETLERLEKRTDGNSIRLGKARAEVSRCQEALGKLKLQLQSRQRLIGHRCQACGQKVSGSAVEALREHVLVEKKRWESRLRKFHRREKQVRKEVEHGRSRLKRLQIKYNNYRNQRREKGVLRDTIEKKQRDIVGSTPFSIQYDLLTTSYSRKLSRLLVLQQKKFYLEHSIEDYAFWQEGFGNRGVRALVVREILPALNHQLENYAREIFGDGTTIKLSATQETKSGEDRELLNIQYQSPSGANDYVGESSGGRRRADLCVLLVFSWLARTSNVLFVDEFFDHLDSAGRERALDILRQQRGSIFIVTHERGIKSQLSKVWTVVKEHRASRLEMGP
jgi:DNA repair exonuclease SbcCD ATPase subunit